VYKQKEEEKKRGKRKEEKSLCFFTFLVSIKREKKVVKTPLEREKGQRKLCRSNSSLYVILLIKSLHTL